MMAICEEKKLVSIETAVENAINFSVYAVIRLLSIIGDTRPVNFQIDHQRWSK